MALQTAWILLSVVCAIHKCKETCCIPCLQNSPYWEITAGFIGSVKATIPITTLSIDNCQAALDEILITIKPKRLHHPSVHDVGASGNLSASNVFTPDSDDQTAAQDIMTDGIMQIAGGIETVVQQLQLQVIADIFTGLCLLWKSLESPRQLPLHCDCSASAHGAVTADLPVTFVAKSCDWFDVKIAILV